MTWHVQPESLARYLTGRAELAEAMSIEAHVVGCATCRAEIARQSEAPRLRRTWAAVIDVIDRPPRSVLERALTRIGISDGRARLLASTPSMHLPWVLATIAALAFALVAAAVSDSTRMLAVMLLIAPLAPVVGVALSYGPGVDAIHELSLSTPIDKFDLLLVRAAAVLGLASALSVGEAVGVPGAHWTIAAWLLPAAALTSVALALSTWLPTRTAAIAASGAWVVAVAIGLKTVGSGLRLENSVLQQLILFRPAGQLVLAVIAAVAMVVALERRDQFDIGGAA